MRLIAFLPLLTAIAAAQETPLAPLLETTAAARSGSTVRLQERARLLRDLIRSPPAEAWRFLLSDHDAARLRALDPNAPIETWGTAESTRVSIADDFDGRRATYIYDANGITGYQESARAPSVKCGDTIRLQGYRIGDTMLVAEATVTRPADATPACNPVGPQKLAIIYARIPGLGSPLATMDQLKTWIFSGDLSAPRFWDISSFGAMQVSGDVIGPVDLDKQYGCNDTAAIQNAAYSAAAKLADLTQYNRIFIAHPIVGSCAWGAVDTLGCSTISLAGGGRHVTSMGEMNTPATLAGVQRYIFHEVGHGLGLTHSNAYIAPADTLPPDRSRSTVLEYGDQYSTLGSGSASTYALPQKEILGWLKEAETVRTVSDDVDADLAPMGVEGAGLRGLKVRRKTQAGNEFVWVEYRTQAGTDVNLPALQPGAILHYTPTQTNLSGELLDATPGGPGDQQSYLDPVLVVGRKWQDPYSDVSIEVLSATPDRLKVSVRYAQPCATVTWPANKVIPPQGGPFSPQIAVSGDCGVVARANNYWIQPTSPGAADFLAQPNKSTLSRTATVTVNRQTITVRQDGPKADLKVDSMAPLTGTLRAGTFDQFQLNVSAPNGPSSIGEVRILLAAAATSDGACLLTYSGGLMHLANNAGTADAGVLHPNMGEQTSNNQCSIATLGVTNVTPTLVRLTFHILPSSTTYLGEKKLFVALRHTQDTAIGSYAEAGRFTVATGCQAFLVPPRVSVGGAGGVSTFTVNAPANCTWDVAAPDEWTRVTVNRNASPPVVAVAVTANPSPAARRSGIAVLGAAFVVDQLGAGIPVSPTVTFDGAEGVISRRGGMGQAYFTTNLPPDQVYPASDQPWLRVDYRSSLNASIGQSVLYYAEPNLSPVERVATILAGPASLALIQEAGPADPGANVIQTLSGAGLIQAGSALEVHVARPGQIAYDRNGNLYVTEPDYYRVLKVALDRSVTTVAGNGAPGEPLYGTPAAQSRLLAVRGVAADSKGNVFISMASDVVRVSPDGILTRVVSDMSSAQGLAVDDQDNLYIADSGVHRIFVLHPDGKYEPFAGTGAAGFSGDGGNALSALLRAPASVAAGSDGSVYIADAGNFAIRRVSGGNIETIIGTGANGAATDGKPAKGQAINAPGQLAADRAGTVYWIAAGSRVRSIDPAGIVGSLAGGGTVTPLDGTPAVSAGIEAQGVAVDPTSAGQLAAVSDRINNAIRQVDEQRALRKLAGRDTTESVGDSGAASLALLYWPLFGAYGPDGQLYFSDSRNNRIRRINGSEPSRPSPGPGGSGSPAIAAPQLPLSCTSLRAWRSMAKGICTSPTPPIPAFARSITPASLPPSRARARRVSRATTGRLPPLPFERRAGWHSAPRARSTSRTRRITAFGRSARQARSAR